MNKKCLSKKYRLRRSSKRKTKLRKTKLRKTKLRKTKSRKNRRGGDADFPLSDQEKRDIYNSPEYSNYMTKCRVKNPITGKFRDKYFSSDCNKQKKEIEDMVSRGPRSAITIDDKDVKSDIVFAQQYKIN